MCTNQNKLRSSAILIHILIHYKQAGLCYNSTTALMGEKVDPTMKGTFYLSTNAEAPFAVGAGKSH